MSHGYYICRSETSLLLVLFQSHSARCCAFACLGRSWPLPLSPSNTAQFRRMSLPVLMLQVKQLENTATKLRDDVAALGSLELQMATAKQQAASSSAAESRTLSDLRVRIDTIDKSLAGMQTIARGPNSRYSGIVPFMRTLASMPGVQPAAALELCLVHLSTIVSWLMKQARRAIPVHLCFDRSHGRCGGSMYSHGWLGY